MAVSTISVGYTIASKFVMLLEAGPLQSPVLAPFDPLTSLKSFKTFDHLLPMLGE